MGEAAHYVFKIPQELKADHTPDHTAVWSNEKGRLRRPFEVGLIGLRCRLCFHC